MVMNIQYCHSEVGDFGVHAIPKLGVYEFDYQPTGLRVAGFPFWGGSDSGFWFCGGFGFVVGLMDGLGFAVGLDLGFEGVGRFGLSVVSTAPVGFGGHGIGGFAIADHKFGCNVNSISGFCE
uniref:Uncharacterized protein n=2 Tax=Fagus sylvatica TaxID=28930 RepID=A0A2N9I8Y1_FAGSY